MDWLIEMHGPEGAGWVATGGGAPECTTDRALVERYATEQEACENMHAFRKARLGCSFQVRPAATLADAGPDQCV